MSLVSKFIAIYAHVVAIYFDAYGNISLYTCDNFDPSKKLFIFKKKRKRIDTIFINFHLSIVVLLSRCNKYIYIYIYNETEWFTIVTVFRWDQKFQAILEQYFILPDIFSVNRGKSRGRGIQRETDEKRNRKCQVGDVGVGCNIVSPVLRQFRVNIIVFIARFIVQILYCTYF